MPIYEYYCPDHHRIFAFFTQKHSLHDRVPRCPDDATHRLVKVVSGFFVGGRRTEADADPDAPSDGLDDPRVEAAMSEMEREMAGMDEDHPDPRTLGRFMRRMADLTGQPMDGGTEEMIRRLEAGEDPEKLEEKLGDTCADADSAEDGEAPGPAPPDLSGPCRPRAGAPRRRPAHDSQLRTLEDYL